MTNIAAADWRLLRRHTTTGGSLAEIAEPHVRAFPHGGFRRRVYAQISSWDGVAPGASHYYAEIKEEHNFVWSGADCHWVAAWDDAAGVGKRFEERCPSEELARAWILRTFQKEFDRRTHSLQYECGTRRPRWMALRDGD